MIDVLSYAPAFATPYCGDTSEIASALAARRLTRTRSLIADSLAASGAEETARAALAFVPGSGRAWRPEAGLALKAHRDGSCGLAALQLALACAGTGGNGCLESALDGPEWLYLDGWLTAAAGRCSVRSCGRSIGIDSETGSAEFVISAQNRWVPAKSVESPWTAYSSGGLAPRYVTVSGLRHSVEGFPWICEKPSGVAAGHIAIDPGPAAPRIATIHRGWEVVLEHAPVFGFWIASTAEGCLLLDPGEGQIAQSGSSFDHPGLIAIEPPDSPVFCGEILVHECSHQQLLIYTMMAPMVKPGSRETYYSPIKRADRSIDRVLTGAHAVGNILLYYAALERGMDLDRPGRARVDQHRAWFTEDYRSALDRSESLTEAGRALWDSLRNAVDSAMKQ